jgi:hypothetical protein
MKETNDGYYLDRYSEALDAMTAEPLAFAEVVDAALDIDPKPFLEFYQSFQPLALRHTRSSAAERLWDVLNASLNKLADEAAMAEMQRLDALSTD